jgi:hypothetical protein
VCHKQKVNWDDIHEIPLQKLEDKLDQICTSLIVLHQVKKINHLKVNKVIGIMIVIEVGKNVKGNEMQII